jgi:hypothetical protein
VDRRDELDRRLGSQRTTIKVDREHDASLPQRREVMSENLDGIGKVKEDQAPYDRVKWFSVPKRPYVSLKE